MIVGIDADGLNVGKRLLKDGIDGVTVSVEDDAGNITLGDVTMNLSNNDNSLHDLIYTKETAPIITLRARNTIVHKGIADINGVNYDNDSRILTITSIAEDGNINMQLERLRLFDLAGNTRSNGLGFIIDTVHHTRQVGVYNYSYRLFYSVKETITRMFRAIGYECDFNTMLLDNLFYGGYINGSYTEAQGRQSGGTLTGKQTTNRITEQAIPDVSCKDFLGSICKTYNLLWFIKNNRIMIVRKTDWLRARKNDTPISLKVLKGSLLYYPNQGGFDSITINVERGAIDDIEYGQYQKDYTKVTRSYQNGNTRDISIPFKLSDVAFRYANDLPDRSKIQYTIADDTDIPAEDGSNNYILRLYQQQNDLGPYKGERLTIDEISVNYEIDITCTDKFECSYSLLDENIDLEPLLQPYARIAPPFTSVLPFFITEANFDLHGETVTIKATGYEI